MASAPAPPLGLGEVVLRVRDLDAMQRFYQEVFGLELLRRFERMAFLRVAAGRAGHTTIVALFDEVLPAPIGLAVTLRRRPRGQRRRAGLPRPRPWPVARQQNFTIPTYALHTRRRCSSQTAGRPEPAARRTTC